MALVLDSSILVGVAMNDATAEDLIGKAIERGRCYVTIASTEEFACYMLEHGGSDLAEKWIGWLYSVGNTEIVESTHPEYTSGSFIYLVAEAYIAGRVQVPAASAAALARHLHIPVLTSRPAFAELERAGFCEVRWSL